MSTLNPELQQLFRAGKLANQPTDADRLRVLSGLQNRLGSVAVIEGEALGKVASRGTARTVAAKTVGITVAALTLAVGSIALMYSLTRRSVPEVVGTLNDSVVSTANSATATSEPTIPEMVSPALLEETQPKVEAHPQSVPTSASPRGTTRLRDNLAEEVAILSRAQAELHGGRADNALRALAEHERKFKRGLLAEERTAARIQALCALGRGSEANALLGRLSPQSLTGESARQVCSSNKKSATGR